LLSYPPLLIMNQEDSSNTNIARVIQLNNDGAYFIQHAKFNKAIAVLNDALVGLRQLTRHEASIPRPSNIPSLPTSSKPSFSFLDNGTTMYSSRATPGNESSYGNFVFRDPVRIDWDPSVAAGYSLFSEVTVVVFHNLALAILLHAMEHGGSKTAELERASKILKYALIAIQRDSMGVHVVLTCALLNNLGQIHMLRREEALAKRCFAGLLQTLMYMVVSGESGKVQHHQLAGFFANTSVMSENTTAPCA
jgi:hypothetical protein